jgi:hypothetical protein
MAKKHLKKLDDLKIGDIVKVVDTNYQAIIMNIEKCRLIFSYNKECPMINFLLYHLKYLDEKCPYNKKVLRDYLEKINV